METVNEVYNQAKAGMKKAVQHLETELLKIRAGKASPTLLDGIVADYYGNPTPINQVANIIVADSRTVTVQPWEKNMIAPIERAIMMANIGLTPQNDGELIRLFMPPVTEERRKELVKRAFAEGENAKVSARNVRREAIEELKKMQKEGLSEDDQKAAEKQVQEITDSTTEQIEAHCKDKEIEIMTI